MRTHKYESDKVSFEFAEVGTSPVGDDMIGLDDMEEAIKALDIAARMIRKFSKCVHTVNSKVDAISDCRQIEDIRRKYRTVHIQMNAQIGWDSKP